LSNRAGGLVLSVLAILQQRSLVTQNRDCVKQGQPILKNRGFCSGFRRLFTVAECARTAFKD